MATADIYILFEYKRLQGTGYNFSGQRPFKCNDISVLSQSAVTILTLKKKKKRASIYFHLCQKFEK